MGRVGRFTERIVTFDVAHFETVVNLLQIPDRRPRAPLSVKQLAVLAAHRAPPFVPKAAAE